MKKQSNALILAAFALGLVCAPLALVQASVDSGFRIINNAGGLIDVECSIPGSPSVEPFGNGDTEYLTCNGTVLVKMKGEPGGPPLEATFSFQCASDQVQETTVTTASDALSVTHSCEDLPTEESSTEESSEE